MISLCRTPVLQEANRSLHLCSQDVQITCTTNSKVNSSQCYAYNIIRVYLLKNDPRSEKDYRASNITTFILSVAWTTSTGDDWGRGMPSFLPLTRTSCWGSTLLLHLCQWKASLSILMVCIQQVGGKYDMRAIYQGWPDSGLPCRKWWLHHMCNRTTSKMRGFVSQDHIGGFSTKRECANTHK
jgi:hypothetical protein